MFVIYPVYGYGPIHIYVESMISFTRGKAIAAVCGGLYDGKIVRITDDGPDADRKLEEEEFFDLVDSSVFQEHQGRPRAISTRGQHQIRRAVMSRTEPSDEYLVPAYRNALAMVNEALKKELWLENGTMFMLPDTSTERVFIAGKSGSGKSTLAACYMNEFLRMYPDRKIYLISRHEEENAYREIEHKAIPLDSFANAETTPTIESLAGSLVVFDDCDNIIDKPISLAIKKMCDDIISNGRKYGIYAIWLNHQLMEYSKTRNLLNEANKVIFFNSGNNYHIQQYLHRYVGVSKENMKKILALPSRWTMICLTLPSYILHEHGAFLL